MIKTKLLILSLLAIFITPSFSRELPVIPENCFEASVYCHHWKVFESKDPENPHGKRVIRIMFFAQLDAYEYDSYHNIIDTFEQFDQWPEYTKNSENVTITYSVKLPTIVNEEGQEIHRQEAHYTLKAPRIIGGKVNVRERVLYQELEKANNAETSWSFTHDATYNLQGLKHKTGVLDISFNKEQEVYFLYLTLDVIPEINILPKLAAPFIEAGIVDIFKGMFKI